MKRKQRAPGTPSRLSLANWPVSIRLAALFVMASLLGAVFGGLRVADAVGQARAYARTTQLAALGEQVTAFAQSLEDERDLTAGVAALTTLQKAAVSDKAAPPVADQLSQAMAQAQAALSTAQRTTNSAAQLTETRAAGIGPAFPSALQAKAASVVAQAKNLTGLRAEVAGQHPAAVIGDYSGALANLFAVNDEITSTSGDGQLTDGARALGALSRAKDQASQQRAILYVALIESGFDDAGSVAGKPSSDITGSAALRAAGGMQALIIARSLQLTDVLSFQSAAAPDQEAAYLASQAGPRVGTALQIGTLVSMAGDPRAVERSSLGVTSATAPDVWYRDMSAVVGGMRTTETSVASALVARSELLQHQAFRSAVLTAAVTVAAVLAMLLATALVGRSLLRPLRRLQADALEIAAVRLPGRVAAAALGTDVAEAAGAGVEPIGVRSTDEIGKVARAFDQVHAEAVRLASTEAQLRGNLNTMFISLSRRSVPLIERLARMIDSLEQNEDDPEQLANLFAMDHMVTRMRRNSENLLVLGGEEPVRKWSGPVPLSDVTHAAAAEIEQYNRVVLTVQPGVVVSGQAAADIVHLLAELIENATLFSPRETQVHVSAREMGRGGVALEVRDDGVGVSASRLADMNWRLDHPPVIDVSVSRHMGLFAVSRLAARHGIRIRLRAGTPQGLSALIWLPASITRLEPVPPGGVHSRGPAVAAGALGPADAAGVSGVSGVSGAFAPARHGAGKHRLGLLGSTADQPALADPPASADQSNPADQVAAADQSTPGDQRAEATTTAWFAAKAPSGRSAPPQEIGSQGTSPQGTGPQGNGPQGANPYAMSPPVGYGDWSAPAADGPADPPALARRTPAGLPQRVRRAAARDAAPVLSAPVPSLPPASSPADPVTAPRAAFPQAGLPRRRSAEAARSRLAGFQLGGRAAAEDREPD